MHQTVLRLLAAQRPGLVLDIPSGKAPIVEGARAHGHRVVEVDLFPHPEFRGVIADACAPLPFADGVFDAVVSMEVHNL